MRLTKLNKLSGEYTISENTNYEDAMRKLHEYEEAEEQGLIIKLPCKVGDTVYSIFKGEVVKFQITFMYIGTKGVQRIHAKREGDDFVKNFKPVYIGKTVFSTEAEALQALKERENQ